MKTTYNKKQIMKNAWNIKRKNTSVSFSECLTIAWSRAKCDVMEARREAEKAKQSINTPFIPLSVGNLRTGIDSYYENGVYSGD